MRKSAVLLGLVLAVAVVWAAELKPDDKTGLTCFIILPTLRCLR